jgi:hypothetical protein
MLAEGAIGGQFEGQGVSQTELLAAAMKRRHAEELQ